MGVEAFAAHLRPHFAKLRCDVLESTLVSLGFERTAAPAFPGEACYLSTDAMRVFEATIRGRAFVTTGMQSDTGDLVSAEIRVAVCHGPAVLTPFFGVVQFLAQEHGLAVSGDGSPAFEPKFLPEWEKGARSRFEALRENWIRLFRGDTEEIPLSGGDAWRYFLDKHRGDTAGDVAALAAFAEETTP